MVGLLFNNCQLSKFILSIVISVLLFNLFSAKLYAEVATDGSLGAKTELSGPNFEIGADLGKQNGSNLFHSFDKFNLNRGESANFSGPSSVENILARVTGENISSIDGTLGSNIANANLYLLNPKGFVFGKNARLDISGSFYASTADGISFGEEGSFYANPNGDSDSILSSAQPEAFGFLGSPATIQIQGNSIKNSTFYAPNGQIDITTDNSDLTIQNSMLIAPNGLIDNISSIKLSSNGDIQLVNTMIDASGILITDDEGQESGGIAGEITLKAGKSIQICAMTGCNSPFSSEFMKLEYKEISDTVDNFVDSFGSKIISVNQSDGKGGKIQITTPALKISYSRVNTSTENTGDAGDIEIAAKNVSIDYGSILSMVASDNSDSSQAGKISVHGMDGIGSFADEVSLSKDSTIESSVGNAAGGYAGDVDLKTQHLLLDRSEINSFNYAESGKGKAGTITISADTVLLANKSHLVTHSFYGEGGNVDIQVRDYFLAFDNSIVTAETWSAENAENAGNIHIYTLRIFALDKSHLLATAEQGDAGNIKVEADYSFMGNENVDYKLQPFASPHNKERQHLSECLNQGNCTYSLIDATSKAGVFGKIEIEGQRWGETLDKPPPPGFLTNDFSYNRCSLPKENQSRFTITSRDILPIGPEDLRTYTIRLGNYY